VIDGGLKAKQVTASSGECTISKSSMGLWLLLKGESVLTTPEIMLDRLFIAGLLQLMISDLTCIIEESEFMREGYLRSQN